MSPIFAIQEHHLTACSQLSVTVFNCEPWNEAWTLETAQTRLSHIFNSPGFVGLGYQNPDLIGLVLGNWEPWEEHRIFFLREICIHPKYQHRGIGSQLIDQLNDDLSHLNVRRIYLITQNQTPAEAFYLRNEFSHSAKMLLMTKTLC